jgi:hypothetical protein
MKLILRENNMASEKLEDGTVTHPMYCVKCRTMVSTVAPKKVVFKSNRHALQGKCHIVPLPHIKLLLRQNKK